MRLAGLQEFRRLIYSPDSAPSVATLRAQIDREELPGGRKIGGRYWVDLDAFDQATGLRNGLIDQQKQASKNPLLAGLV